MQQLCACHWMAECSQTHHSLTYLSAHALITHPRARSTGADRPNQSARADHPLTHSLTHARTHSPAQSINPSRPPTLLIHSLTHSLRHSLTHPHTHSPAHSLNTSSSDCKCQPAVVLNMSLKLLSVKHVAN